MRLIDADALQNILLPITTALEHEYGSLGGAVSGCMKHLDNAPTVDAVPVRHGRWVRIGIKGRKGLPIYPCCSVCGIVSAAFRSEWEGLRGPWKFCPNCGAKMDLEG